MPGEAIFQNGVQYPFLSEGGEMGERIRSFDWSRTAVGPVETWPQSLRTVLGILLDSGYPMYIGWGPEFTQFYNDAYRPILGSKKHPAALGQTTPECFAEIWEFIGPMFRRVMQEGKNTTLVDQLLAMDRSGFIEECYFTFSYSAIRSETGGVGGVLVTVIETTGRVFEERRQRTLRELATASVAANDSAEVLTQAARILAGNPNDLPFSLLYLADAKGRATLVAASGPTLGPDHIDLDDDSAVWPLGEVARSGSALNLHDVAARIGEVRGSAYPEPVRSARITPIFNAAQLRVTGFSVTGLSPRQVLDDRYETFLHAIAAQLGTALVKAEAYEDERRRAEALAEIDRAKILFFNNVSHEFRTPLTLMLGPLEGMLSRTGDAITTSREELALVHRNGLRLQKLVNTLLDFSRIEAGRVQATYEPVDLAAFTADIASTFRSTMEHAGLEFQVDCPPLSKPVYVDREMWEKIVLNLLSNAFKFTFEGIVRLSLSESDGHVTLSVQDTGIGISEEELDRVFERFHRVKNARGRTFEGTGIGLALIAELARLNGGTVAAKSQSGQGSTFTVTLPFGFAHLPLERTLSPRDGAHATSIAGPYLEEARQWFAEPRSPESPNNAAPAELRGRLLLAEDNADMRDYLCRMLAGDYEVEAVVNGADALQLAHRRPPDLILSDVMMPGVDGFALVKALRASPATASIPVILLSARSGEESRVEGLDAGADDYLVKPFTARELRARVAAHLKLARARKDADERSTRILESITDGFCVLDRDWRFIYFNQAAERILKTNRESMIGKDHWDLFPDTLGTLAETEYRRAVRDNVPVEFEYFLPSLGAWFSVRAYPRAEGGLSIYFRDITGNRRTTELIQAAQDELRLVADAAPVYLAHCDRDRRFLFVNRSYAERFGLTKDQVIGKTMTEILGAAAYERLHPYVEAALNGESVDAELELPYPVIGRKFMHVSYAPDRDANGHVRGLVAAITDISARKKIEETLREREGQLKALVDAAPIGIYMVDSNLRIRQLNPEARPVFGNSGDVVGKDLKEVLHRLWHEEYAGEIVLRFRHTLETGEPYSVEERAEQRRDRDVTHYYKWQVNRITLPDGEPGVVCYFYDISAHVLARQALARSEEQFRTLADNMNQFAWMTDETGWIFWYNQRWYDYTGTTLEQMQGWGWQAVHHPRYVEGVVKRFRQALDRGEGWEDTFPLRGKDGQYRWFLSRAQPIRDSEGRVLRWFGTNTDITEQRRNQEALRRANQDLEQFAYSASHDLQEPLRQVAIYSQLLEKKFGHHLAGKGKDYLGHLIEGAQRMETLIRDLLAYSQAAAAEGDPSEPVDTQNIIAEVQKSLAAVINETGAVIEASGLPVVSGHAVPFTHLFQNLVSNALKYRSDHPPRIRVTAEDQGDAWLFTVRDNGIGIPKEYQGRIFGIFKRLHDRQQYPGTGIGLAICQKVVERSGGRIWVESEEGKGSKFLFTIPHTRSDTP